MAARNRTWTPEVVRQKIRTSMIAKRLQNHIFGKCSMSQTQVRAAEILLARTLPTLSQTDLNIEGELGISDISDKPLSADEWAASAQDHLATASGTTKAPH
jgi:hypothetical protein